MPARHATAELPPSHAPRCSERQLSAAVVELAEVLGWRVYTVRRSDKAIVASRMGAGFPDFVWRPADWRDGNIERALRAGP